MSAKPAIAATMNQETGTRYLLWWLLLAIFFEYARPAAFLPVLGAIKLNSLIPLSLLIITIFARGLRPVQDALNDPLTKWILIYFLIILLSMTTAEVTFRAYRITKLVLGHVLLFYMVVRIATTFERIRSIFTILIIAHLFLLLMNPHVVLHPEQRNYIQGGSFLGDGNDFSLSICILIPMAIELALASATKLKRFLWWGVLLLLILVIIASSSRGASLALIAVAGYLWLQSPRKILVLAAMVVAAVIALAYAPDSYFDRLNSIANYEEDGSAMGRILAWKSSIRMFLDNPLLGVSAGHFPIAFGTRYRPPLEYGNIAWLTAHSMYFLVLGELALPGIIAFLMLVFGNIWANTRLRRELLRSSAAREHRLFEVSNDAVRILYLLNASMLGLAVAGAFLSAAYYPHIFMLTGLMVAARRIAQQPATVQH